MDEIITGADALRALIRAHGAKVAYIELNHRIDGGSATTHIRFFDIDRRVLGSERRALPTTSAQRIITEHFRSVQRTDDGMNVQYVMFAVNKLLQTTNP